MRDALRMAGKQWKYQFRNADIWIVFLAVCAIMYSVLRNITNAVNVGSVGIWAVYPVCLTDRWIGIYLFAGVLILVADLPASYRGMEYEISRMKKASWYFGQMLYGLYMISTYFLFVFLFEVLCFGSKIELSTEWGGAIYDGSIFSGGTLSVKLNTILADYHAATGAMAESFLLSLLVGYLFAMICLVCNMFFSRGRIGVLLCSMLIAESMIAYAFFDQDLKYWSPLGLLTSYYHGTRVPVSYAVMFLFLCNAVLGVIGGWHLRKMDFQFRGGM